MDDMTHFESVLVQTIQDLAKQVQDNNELCARLDERSAATERRLVALETAVLAAPPSTRRANRITAKDAGIGATALVALATALLQALSGPPAAPAPPRPPAAVTGAP